MASYKWNDRKQKLEPVTDFNSDYSYGVKTMVYMALTVVACLVSICLVLAVVNIIEFLK